MSNLEKCCNCCQEVAEGETSSCLVSAIELLDTDIPREKHSKLCEFDDCFYCNDCMGDSNFCKDCCSVLSPEEMKTIFERLK